MHTPSPRTRAGALDQRCGPSVLLAVRAACVCVLGPKDGAKGSKQNVRTASDGANLPPPARVAPPSILAPVCARASPLQRKIFTLLLLLSITRPGKQHNVHTPVPGLLRLRRSQAKEHTTKWLCNRVQRRGNLTKLSLSLAHAKHTRFGS